MTDKLGALYLSNICSMLKNLKIQSEKAFVQISEDDKFDWSPNEESNSLSVLIRHFSGNMKSRWTDIFNTDGEKLSRKRDEEFNEHLKLTRSQLMQVWEDGWNITLNTIESLQPDDLMKTIYIRKEPHTVMEAINRQLGHYSVHYGQIMYLVKIIINDKWESLSIPKKRI